jgi:hypothetical protein
MFRRLKRLLGQVPTPEQWDEQKSVSLQRLLGTEHNMVMHALIPFAIGGTLDQYYYPQSRGYAIATKELIDEYGDGPRNRHYRAYEWCMFSPAAFDLKLAHDEKTPMGQSHRLLSGALNALARYCTQASLNPNETMEFPPDSSETLGGKCLILDHILRDDRGLMIGKREFGLMVAILVHRSEMEFAREQSGQALLGRLREAGVYPYSDLDRQPVA